MFEPAAKEMALQHLRLQEVSPSLELSLLVVGHRLAIGRLYMPN